MEDVWEDDGRENRDRVESNPKEGFKSRLRKLEEQLKYGKMKNETIEVEKTWKFPFKMKRALNSSNSKKAQDKVLVEYYNIKGEIEHPVLVPLYSGNIIIHKNKAYEFDPRAVWTRRFGRKIYRQVSIREIDRRPISNLDWDEVKAKGDSTDSDRYLLRW